MALENDLNIIHEFFTVNAMSGASQLNLLERVHGVKSKVNKFGEVEFDNVSNNPEPVALALHDKVLQFESWRYIRSVARQIEPAKPVEPPPFIPNTEVSGVATGKTSEE